MSNNTLVVSLQEEVVLLRKEVHDISNDAARMLSEQDLMFRDKCAKCNQSRAGR